MLPADVVDRFPTAPRITREMLLGHRSGPAAWSTPATDAAAARARQTEPEIRQASHAWTTSNTSAPKPRFRSVGTRPLRQLSRWQTVNARATSFRHRRGQGPSSQKRHRRRFVHRDTYKRPPARAVRVMVRPQSASAHSHTKAISRSFPCPREGITPSGRCPSCTFEPRCRCQNPGSRYTSGECIAVRDRTGGASGLWPHLRQRNPARTAGRVASASATGARSVATLLPYPAASE